MFKYNKLIKFVTILLATILAFIPKGFAASTQEQQDKKMTLAASSVKHYPNPQAAAVTDPQTLSKPKSARTTKSS